MMYHHLNSDRCSNDYDIFEAHLKYISQNFTSTFPTDILPANPICLVFDDGYYDFYKLIFPLLQRYKIKALLAVIPKYILDDCTLDDEQRLQYEHNDLLKYYKMGTLCTYKELQLMINSGLVQVVSHSYSHKNLLENDINLEEELKKSKRLIEDKLYTKVESFVFPFGKYNQNILDKTKKYYKYAFRIGNGTNKDFNGINGVIYRIDGDNLRSANGIFNIKNMLKFHFKSQIKKLIGKN